eukprot:scaffold111967_cov39-Tisochrysis_lutea.AAC.2
MEHGSITARQRVDVCCCVSCQKIVIFYCRARDVRLLVANHHMGHRGQSRATRSRREIDGAPAILRLRLSEI